MANESKQMEYTSKMQANQCKILLSALNAQQFTDVTCIIGQQQQQFNINRLFLSLISPVFKAMLYGKMQESEPNSDVIIEDIEPEIFECIINFAYCNNPNITSKNVLLLIRAGDKYQIDALLALCHEYFRSCLNNQNFCTYCYEAIQLNIFSKDVANILESYLKDNYLMCLTGDNIGSFLDTMVELNCATFIAKCEQFLQESADKLEKTVRSKGFALMRLKTVRLFLKIYPLKIKEELLWDGILKWADYQSKQIDTVSLESEEDTKNEDENIDRNKSKEHRIYFLKSVRDLIRFPLMNGEYFVKYVEPEKILNNAELITLLLYFQQNSRGCGDFDASLRTPEKQLTFTLNMSSKYSCCSNTYDSLVTNDLADGCGTYSQQQSYIEAIFMDKVNITKIEIAAPSRNMKTGADSGARWGCAHLNMSRLQKYDLELGDWTDMKVLKDVQANKIKSLKFSMGEVKTTKLRLYRHKKNNMAVGCWRIFGF